MVQASECLKFMLRNHGLRNILIQQISDDYKSLYHVRPRWKWDAFTLMELWEESRDLSRYLAQDGYAEETEKFERDLNEWCDRQYEADYQCARDHWDDIADKLEGIR